MPSTAIRPHRNGTLHRASAGSAVIACALLVVGCGSGNDSPGGGNAGPTPPPAGGSNGGGGAGGSGVPIAFEDATAASGISYAGPSWAVAWGDANGDARPDLYIGNHGEPHNLYLNQGQGSFKEIAPAAWPRPEADSHGAVWADFDNDGDEDLVELLGNDRGSGKKSNHFFVNEGGRFVERATELGLDDPYGRGRMPLWFDWDLDGFLDVLFLNAPGADGPSTLFRNNRGRFERTEAVDVVGMTKFALLASLQPGKRHVIVSGQPYPQRIYDANQSSLPMRNLRHEMKFPQSDNVTDAALSDFNGDQVDDLFAVSGMLGSDARIDGDRLKARIVVDEKVRRRSFRFKADGPLEIALAPTGPTWWSIPTIYLGSTGVHPTSFPFKVSPDDSRVHGLSDAKPAKGIFIGYDPAARTWEVAVLGTGHEEATFAIDATSLSTLETVGFGRFDPTGKVTLLVSQDERLNDATAASGLSAVRSNCFSVAAADFDNDGDVDAFATCSGPIGGTDIPNLLFENIGGGRFSTGRTSGGITRSKAGVADSVAAADFDLDGFVDLVLTNGQGAFPFNDGPTQLYRNKGKADGNRNHWIQIDLEGVRSNRDAVGSRVTLTADGRTQSRMQRGGVHSGAQDHARIHFGLGSSTSIDVLTVEWPDGAKQDFKNVAVDQVVKIVEGASAPVRVTATGG